MSDVASSLGYEEQLAQVRRAQEETRKFVAEQHKLTAEAAKFQRGRALYPVALAIGVIGAVIGSAATLLVHWLR